jgi:hypothetical protein
MLFDTDFYIFDQIGEFPTEETVDRLRRELPELFRCITTDGAFDRYVLNWLNIPDQLGHWFLLDWELRCLLSAFCQSSWEGHGLRKGLKTGQGMGEHVLLMLLSGCHANEVAGRSGSRLITGNFRKDGLYPVNHAKLRLISPREAANYATNILKIYNFEALMADHWAHPVVIHAPASLQLVGQDAWRAQPAYASFYRQSGELLDTWYKQRHVRAIFASHEISCSSIWEGRFHPHTHAIVFTDDGDPHFAWELPDGFKVDPELPTRDARAVRNIVRYITQAASIARTYRQEVPGSRELRREFNVRTVNAWSNLVALMKAEVGGVMATIRRTKALGLPRRNPQDA